MAQGWKLHKGALTDCTSLPSGSGVKFEGDLDVLTTLHRRRVGEHIAKLIERVAPGTVTYCGRTIRKEDGGTLSGQAIKGKVILLSVDGFLPAVLETAYHELWHVIEKRMTDDEIEFVDRILDRGGSWYGCDYLDDGAERAARTFASWAMLFENGISQMSFAADGDEAIFGLFDRVLLGEFGKRQVRDSALQCADS